MSKKNIFNSYIKLESIYDVIIVGSGISGLMCALNIESDKKVILITKSNLNNSNSNLAQGGIAASINQKNKASHIEDTLKAGSFINNKKVVEKVINYSDEIVEKLIGFDVKFDRDANNNILFTKEGGHSERRILHCKDQTGEKIMESLIYQLENRTNIEVRESSFALDILMHDDEAFGLIVKDENDNLKSLYSNSIILASGGIGRIFTNSTNTLESTGDGVAMAIRAGAKLNDMEFVQFHPTAFNVNIEDGFLISEAVRGEGGKLLNSDGRDFMMGVHKLKELAPRDVVSQAIFRELKSGRQVFLDIRHKTDKYLKNRFPYIYNHCICHGINMSKDLIPIKPIQHYFMGGIKVDDKGRSSVKGLYAIGECANTGAHGANRLASNSLLEASAYALIVSREINEKPLKIVSDYKKILTQDIYTNNFKYTESSQIDLEEILEIESKIQNLMSTYVSIEKDKVGLKKVSDAFNKLEKRLNGVWMNDIQFYEMLNIFAVAKKIVQSSLARDVSIGSHIISDRSIL